MQFLVSVLSLPMIDNPFFDASLPSAVRIAGAGSIIGHEIGHAFDRSGLRFDGDGKMQNSWNRRTWKSTVDEKNV
uniref:Peptidase_M13 domain-containing protein n=1 Tax=Caenorhabditis japonica TaxID=281687 RepID=A0A8R1EFI2_CAEJA